VPEDEKEEELPDVEFPSKLTYGEKLMKMKKWQTPKKKKEGEKEDAIGNESADDDDESEGGKKASK
jgi:hypothetical protein